MRLGLVLPVLLLAGCSGDADLAAADQAVAKFHGEFNAGAFDQAYSESDGAMKQAMTRANFDKFLAWAHTKLGNFRTGKQVGWKVNYNAAGTYTALQYQSRFDHGAVTETFIVANGNGGAKIVNAHWDSPLLIPG